MSTATMNIDEIRAAFFAEQQKSEGGTTPFLKLTGGNNVLRLLPGSPPFLRIRRHKYSAPGGRLTNAMDLAWLTQNPDLLEPALEVGTISQADVSLARKFGDPFTALGTAAKAAGVDRNAYNGAWPQTRYFLNVVDRNDDGSVKMWDASKTQFEGILSLMDVYPEIFSDTGGFDIFIKGNGKNGLQRRYESAIAARDKSDVGFDYEDMLVDLQSVALRGIVSFEEKRDHMFALYGDVAVRVGMVPGEWGV